MISPRFIYIWTSFATICWCNGITYLQGYSSVASFSQSYIGFNSSISQLSWLGVNATSSIFEHTGYTSDAVEHIQGVFNVTNFNLLYFDLYWNRPQAGWQLCPGVSPNKDVKCQNNLTLEVMLEAIDNITKKGPDKLVLLMFNLQEYRGNDTSFAVTLNLTHALADKLDRVLFDQFQATTLYDFLYSNNKRTLPMIFQNTAASGDQSLSSYAYNITYQDPAGTVSQTNLSSTSNWNFKSSSSSDLHEIQRFLVDGDSVILNTNHSMFHHFDNLTWLWNLDLTASSETHAPDPAIPLQILNASNAENGGKSFRCAVIYESGLFVENCYQAHFVACQSKLNNGTWVIDMKRRNYFDARLACGDDLDDTRYTLGMPKQPRQLVTLIQSINSLAVKEPVWVDLNCIFAQDCWIYGGPDAFCPFKNPEQNKKFIRMLSPIAIFIIFIFSLIMVSNSHKVPIQKNRKYWKKLISDYAEEEYEGVPA